MRYFVTLFYITISFITQAQEWTQLPDFPGTERDDGCFFQINGTFYCGTGVTPGWAATTDFYSIDYANETWDTISSLPAGNERQYASAFSFGIYGYVFGGVNGSKYYNDLWMYNSIEDTWEEKTPMPATGRFGATCFVQNDSAYVVCGRTQTVFGIQEVWAYSIRSDTWTRKKDVPFAGVWRASMSSNGNEAYLIFGKDTNNISHNELYRYEVDKDVWTLLNYFPDKGRSYASMHQIGTKLFVLFGIDSLDVVKKDVWQYNLRDNSWLQLDDIPSFARKGGICFGTENTIYYTTGMDQEKNRTTETWKYNLILATNTEQKVLAINMYPNPTSAFVLVESPFKVLSYIISDVNGNILSNPFVETLNATNYKIYLDNYPSGIYFINMITEERTVTKKIIIE